MTMKRKRLKVKDYSYNSVIVEDLGEINRKYIQRFIDLKTHKSIVTDEFYIAAQQALSEQYEVELELSRRQAQHITNEKFYLADTLTSKLDIFSVKRRFKWRNSPTKELLDRRAASEARGYLEELSEGVEPPDEVEIFIDSLVDEFIPARRARGFLKHNHQYLYFLLSEWGKTHSTDEVAGKLINLFTVPRKREKFLNKYGEYLSNLLCRFLSRSADVEVNHKHERMSQQEEPSTASKAVESAESEVPEEEIVDDLEELTELEENIESNSEEAKKIVVTSEQQEAVVAEEPDGADRKEAPEVTNDKTN